jgi:uncharacterized delta-60 repeat protein
MKRQHWFVFGALLVTVIVLVQATFGARAAVALPPGTLDTTFDPGSGANNAVLAVARQSDGKVLIGGQFTQVDNVMHNSIARLNTNGSLDTAYTTQVTGSGAFYGLTSIAIQTDGKAVIGGLFEQVNSVGRVNIARLTDTGALDTSFNPGTGVTAAAGAFLNVVKLQLDGKVLIGGYFTDFNSTARNNIARLNDTGALDTTFNPGSGTDQEVDSMAVQPSDGKVLIGGYFTTVNGVAHNGLARLNTNGSLDNTFNPAISGTGQVTVLAIAVQTDNKILIGGTFTTVNGVGRNYIARLNSDGSLDTGYDPNSGNEVDTIALQPDGKSVVGGRFKTVDNITRLRIARLDLDGSVDASFNPGAGANYVVFAAAIQPDDKVLIGGGFSSVGGFARACIARLWGGEGFFNYLPLVFK